MFLHERKIKKLWSVEERSFWPSNQRLANVLESLQSFMKPSGSCIKNGLKASWLVRQESLCGKNLNDAVFLDTINMINVKLCVMVVLIELYPFIPLTVTLIVF